MSGGTGAVRGRLEIRNRDSVDRPEPDPGTGTAFQGWSHVSCLELMALPSAVSCGRLHTKQVLWEWQLAHLAADAEILASELLSNAVKASWSPEGAGVIGLRLLANRERVLIEVWDQNPDNPRPRPADDESESGRGFMVIEAVAHRWGCRRVSVSWKVVWCEVVIGCGETGG